MPRRKFLNLVFSLTMVASLLVGGGGTVSAGQPTPPSSPLAGQVAPAMPVSPVDQTKVPHYFGPWTNWALSPLTAPDVTVTIAAPPAGGTQATATATVGANGAVTGLTVINPGSGYDALNPPAVTCNNAAGTNPTTCAVGVVNSSGVVSAINLDPDPNSTTGGVLGGSGYMSPRVTITPATGDLGTGAAATAYGGVDLVDVPLAASFPGYTFPTVEFDLPDDPAGTPAAGHALCLEPNCAAVAPATTVTVTGIHVDTAGSGYSSAPRFVVRDGTLANPINNRASNAAAAARSQALKSPKSGRVSPNQTNLAAAAVALPSGQAPLHILYVTMDAFGAGYAAVPTVTIDDSTGAGAGASATAAIQVGAITGFTSLVGGSGYLTTGGIKKFQDGLPGLCDPSAAGSCTAAANNLGQYVPLGVPDTTTFSGADYYVIALVQHREQMNSSLPATGTLLREYVQLETPANASWSKHVALTTDLKDGTSVPTLMPDGVTQAVAVDNPHYLGPIIQANKDRPVRLVFYNLLPTGSQGDLFIPVDPTFMGAGMGPMDMMAPTDQSTVTDMIRNPMCGEAGRTDADRMNCFAETRATLHLHGGITPWISDGSPHQWITPANEKTGWPEGVAVRQVPDMVGASLPAGVPDCSAASDGCMTFYYTNQQSARLMFYHDHAWGITRLNVYSGEAAGYIIRDATEKALIDNGLIPSGAAEIPLVIQDRTFVPQDSQLYDVKDTSGNTVSYGQDPTWDKTRWGSYGDLWYEHVYMPAQNPNDPSGLSTVGRWFYGPWFWPPTAPTYPAISNPYYNMDPATGFATPLAKPCSLDDPTTWQYDTDPFCEPPQIPGTPNNSAGMEQFNDTPIVNGTAYPTVTLDPKAYRFRMLNAANDRFFNFQWYVADPNSLANPADPTSGTEVAFKPAELAAAQIDPNVVPTPDTTVSLPGPDWVQIGTEGGFLPAPVVVDGQQPITWITDPTRFDWGNVDQHSLVIAPAERADVIVDFSKFAGKTLILYNDAPAAYPGRIATYDYYTGGPDLSPAGAPTVLPGYGPNTRTIMQVKIRATAPAPAFNLTALQNAFKHHVDGSGVFESGQNPIIVGQAGYNTAYGKTFSSGSWCNDPKAPAGTPCDGFARISEQGHDTFKFNTLAGPQIGVTIEPKALHDEMNSTTFEPYGRMSGNIGVEVVPADPNTQNVVLYPFVNPPTEMFDGTNLPKSDTITPISVGTDGTEIWKLTHNGVDTHPIHFHLYDVQVLNRVTWDNIIIPPDPTELGWKDTVRVSPLEDTYFAIRPVIPVLPWELPNSIRPLNPMMPAGDTSMFNNVDPNGNGTNAIVNQLVNFGWEYMLHCHILSHEEMDMMRPVMLAVPPVAPDGTGWVFTSKPKGVQITWKDNSIAETAYEIQKSTDNGVTWTVVGTDPSPLGLPNTAGQTRSFIDTTYKSNTVAMYRVVALNTIGYGAEFPSLTARSTPSPVVIVGTTPATPTNLAAALLAGPQVRLTWTDNATNETGYIVQRSTDAVNFTQVGATLPAGTVTYTDPGVTLGLNYTYRVYAVNAVGASAFSNLAGMLVAAPATPTNFVAAAARQGNNNNVTLNWSAVSNASSYVIQRATNGTFTTGLVTINIGSGATTSYVDTVPRGTPGVTTYYYHIRAINPLGQSAYSTPALSVVTK